jgi:hypothetical protein
MVVSQPFLQVQNRLWSGEFELKKHPSGCSFGWRNSEPDSVVESLAKMLKLTKQSMKMSI